MKMQGTWEYAIVSTVVFGICFLVTGCLVCRHLLVVWSKHGCVTPGIEKDEDNAFDLRVIHYGTLISVLSFWTNIAAVFTMRLFTFGGATDLYPCDAQVLIVLEAFIAAKCAMYAVFVARIRACFDNSVYAYSKRRIRGMYAAVVIVFVVFTCVHPFASGSNWEQTQYAANGRRVRAKGGKRSMAACVVHANKALMPSIALFDVIFSALVVVMFTRPLKDILKTVRANRKSLDSNRRVAAQSTATDPAQVSFELLPLKCTVLSTAAIASTFFAMALTATARTGILFPVDNTVNVACLLLMTKHWEHCYWRVCGPLLRCLSKTHCIAEHNRTNVVALTSIQRNISAVTGH